MIKREAYLPQHTSLHVADRGFRALVESVSYSGISGFLLSGHSLSVGHALLASLRLRAEPRSVSALRVTIVAA